MARQYAGVDGQLGYLPEALLHRCPAATLEIGAPNALAEQRVARKEQVFISTIETAGAL